MRTILPIVLTLALVGCAERKEEKPSCTLADAVRAAEDEAMYVVARDRGAYNAHHPVYPYVVASRSRWIIKDCAWEIKSHVTYYVKKPNGDIDTRNSRDFGFEAEVELVNGKWKVRIL